MSVWTELRECRVVVPPHVVLRAFAMETVVLNVRSGQYHGIDPVGGRFLQVMTEAPTLASVREPAIAAVARSTAVLNTRIARCLSSNATRPC